MTVTNTQTLPTTSSATALGESEEAREEREARASKRNSWGGMDPRDAAALGHAARRAKAAERKAAADLDRLSVIARAGVAAARALTYERQVRILDAMATKAEQGHIQAAVFVRDWLVKLGSSESGDQPGDILDPSDMTPAQRAAVRARLLADLQAAQQSEEPA